MFRRMSLAGDAMSHAVLPGAAVGFILFGLSIVPMTLGGLVAGLAVALLSGLVARVTSQREDASLAAFYLISLALGVLLVSLRGTSVDLMHVLFGTVLALNNEALMMIGDRCQRQPARACAHLAPAVGRVPRPDFSAQCQPSRTTLAPDLPRTGRPQSGRRVSGAGFAARGRAHDAAGCCGPVLGQVARSNCRHSPS